jgi:rhodanese-related sulfurtransferase
MIRAPLVFQNLLVRIQNSMFTVHRSKFVRVRRSIFGLLLLSLLPVTHIWSSPLQLDPIDLGALPVGKATSFKVDVLFSGDSQWITGVESSCSCLVVEQFPETMEKGENAFDITFTPNGAGPSEVEFTISALNRGSGEQVSYDVPVTVVGVTGAEPAQLQGWVQTINSAVLHSNLEQYAIIDIRGSGSYKKAHIPGSFEYTLDAYVALSDQFRKPVVLVGDGLFSPHESLLLERRGAVEDSPLFWLEGGLPAWMRKGLPVQGTWPSQVLVSTISLQRWLKTGGPLSEWYIIDLTGEVQQQNMFFGHSVYRYKPNTESDLGSFLLDVQEDAMRSLNSEGLLVIGDPGGLSYPDIEHNKAVSHTVPVYYLNQGNAAISRWLATARDVQASGTKSYVYSSGDSTFSASDSGATIRTGSRSGCRSCPKR